MEKHTFLSMTEEGRGLEQKESGGPHLPIPQAQGTSSCKGQAWGIVQERCNYCLHPDDAGGRNITDATKAVVKGHSVWFHQEMFPKVHSLYPQVPGVQQLPETLLPALSPFISFIRVQGGHWAAQIQQTSWSAGADFLPPFFPSSRHHHLESTFLPAVTGLNARPFSPQFSTFLPLLQLFFSSVPLGHYQPCELNQ